MKCLSRTMLFFLLLFLLSLCSPLEAHAYKFIRVYRDQNFDMYVNTASIVKNQGVISFSVKRVCSQQGKALIYKEMPAKLKKIPIDHTKDYFFYDTKKGKYNIKICRVYAPGEKEIFKQGSKKWLPVKQVSVADAVISTVNEFLEQKGK